MTITCARCGATGEGLASPPLPTAVGREVHAHTCPDCWKAWLATQVMIINEYRLNLVDPEVRQRLEAEMRRFLCLGEAEAT